MPMALSLWQDMKGQLRVSCRIRPLSVKEKAQNLGDAPEGQIGTVSIDIFFATFFGDILVGWLVRFVSMLLTTIIPPQKKNANRVQSINQPTKQPSKQASNQSINQSINQRQSDHAVYALDSSHVAIVLPEFDTPRVFEFDSVFRPDCSQHLGGEPIFAAKNAGQLK